MSSSSSPPPVGDGSGEDDGTGSSSGGGVDGAAVGGVRCRGLVLVGVADGWLGAADVGRGWGDTVPGAPSSPSSEVRDGVGLALAGGDDAGAGFGVTPVAERESSLVAVMPVAAPSTAATIRTMTVAARLVRRPVILRETDTATRSPSAAGLTPMVRFGR